MKNIFLDNANSYKPADHQPVSSQWILRIAVALIVVLALTSGLFSALYKAEQKKYLRLEDKYVRVRDTLGTEKTQELIDQSRK